MDDDCAVTPRYGWFTEGLATCDRQEAKALLDELTDVCYTPAG